MAKCTRPFPESITQELLLILLLAMGTLAGALPSSAQTFGIYRERWIGLNAGNSDLALLTNTVLNPKWPDNPYPTFTKVLASFTTDVNSTLIGYGQRLRTFIVPPTNGYYIFWIASDDTSNLFLSSDETAENKALIARVDNLTDIREWTREPNQQSPPIYLEKGRRYYMEAIHRQAGGNDNLAVRWLMPDGTVEEPLTTSSPAGTLLIPCTTSSNAPPGIFVQPHNLTVLESRSASFALLATNQMPLSYQWQLNGSDITDLAALKPFYTLSNVNLALNDGQRYRCVVSNALGVVTSFEATLTVIQDTNPPTLVSVANVGSTNLLLNYSEAVDGASATNVANYALNGGSAVLMVNSLDAQNFILTTSPLVFGSNYTLTVNQVRDLALAPNTILTNSQLTFMAVQYASTDIGGSTPLGSFTAGGNGVDVTGGGSDIGGKVDQFQYVFQPQFGNFDVQVRVQALGASDTWAKAGLMARSTLAPNSAFAAVFATPSVVGCYFESRYLNAPTTRIGSFPANYPYTWLRLQRSNTVFNGFASLDGESWAQLGSAILQGNLVFLGMAVDSHDTSQTATAQFRDWGSATAATSGRVALPVEPLAACSRRTGLVISEIMYHPAARADGLNLEYIELYNSQAFFEDLSGYQLAGNVSFIFPEGTILKAGSFLVLARVPADVSNVYGIGNVLGPYASKLPNSSGTVQLLDRHGALLLNVNYDSKAPWPVAPDGAGHSLVLARPSYGEGDAKAWGSSDLIGGSPGQSESVGSEPLRAVVINEFLAHPAGGQSGFVELHNHSRQPVDLSGAFLSDDPAANKFQIPPGTMLAPAGFVSFEQSQLGFGLSAGGGSIFLVNSNRTRAIDAIGFEAQAEGVSSGRFPDGAPSLRELTTLTPGAANSASLVRDIVINELMYKPISGSSEDQYVELYNQGTNPISLSGWRFTAGITYNFSSNTVVAADGYLVVAKNVTNLLAHYSNLNSNNTVGNFGGTLSHGGERVALAMPQWVITTNGTQLTTNTIYSVVDEVTYGVGGRWGQWASGGGSSLELIDPRSDHRLAANWADSDESSKTTNWTNIEYSGVLDNGNGVDNGVSFPPQALQIGLFDVGECLVDNVEVLAGTNTVNLVANSTFETGTNGWAMQGNHDQSFWETNAGYNSSSSLHLRTTGNGDLVVNRVATPLISSPPVGKAATLRAKARWLRGSPEILLTLRGNWLEAYGQMAVPPNLGTPGARNSRALANAGPAIFNVTHTPALPLRGQPVVVSARVVDVDGLSAVNLFYRVDPSSNYVTLRMVDDGSGDDAMAGDGIYSGTIPGQGANATVAFYIEATDHFAPVASTTFPNDAPGRECLVRFGETQTPGSLGTYHLWMTQATFNRWSAREKLSNEPLDCTFVNASQRVIYNMGALYTGSPAHSQQDTPTGAWCDYGFDFPVDDQLLGNTAFNKIKYPSSAIDTTAQCIPTTYWLAQQLGLPYNHSRYINLYVNNVKRGNVTLDLQLPNADVINEFYPADNNGELLKIAVSWESNDGVSGFLWNHARLLEFLTTGGVKKTARYRWNWQQHAGSGPGNDFTNLFNLIDVVNGPTNVYTQKVESLMDSEEWMRIFAVEHIIGNGDSYGWINGQNMFTYKPQFGTWKLLMWDVDFSFGIGDSPSSDNLFIVNDPTIIQMYNNPPFRRAYFRAVQEVVNGPFLTANARLDDTYAGFKANGLPITPPDSIKSYITARRTYLLQQLAGVTAPFSLKGANSFSTSNNLVILSGTAPLDAKTMTLNGNAYPITWTTVSNWVMRIVVTSATNVFNLQAYDPLGHALSNETATVTVIYTSPPPSPQNAVVINEIMYNPVAPGSSYVELLNTLATGSFDLSNWRLDGLGFTFPLGSIITNGQLLVVAKSQLSFQSAYTNAALVAGEFSGQLDPGGQTLTLVAPGPAPAPDVIVNRVRYESMAPWPSSANGFGPSLQLIDAAQDNSRVSNWADGSGWRFASFTGVANNTKFILYLDTPGDLYLDDISLVAGTVAGAGTNLIRNGDFEGPLTTNQGGPWVFSAANLGASSISPTVKHSGSGGLHLVFASPGSSTVYLYQDNIPITNGTYTLSYWYAPTTNGSNLISRVGTFVSKANVRPTSFTPGTANSVTAPLPPYPPLWLNEVLAENVNGILDTAGDMDPWLELYNAGTNVLSLDGLYLANNYSNLTQWAFPTGQVINPLEFKVIFADGEPEQSTASELHTSFRLSSASGSVALSRIYSGQPQVLDYLNYSGLRAGHSYGSFPDGQPFSRHEFTYATPGATNNGTSPTVVVYINEWMASNSRTIANADNNNKYDDWFELYNPGTNTVNLGGYFLTDTLANKFQFQIPAGYAIPAQGYLLVWADTAPILNQANRPDLHVNFNLAKSGEAIALFAADGTQVDAISFGPQTSDVSQGRSPDGVGPIYFLATPTPRALNSLPGNHSPTVAGIADKTIYLGQTLTFTALATDSDQPAQGLAFSLDGSLPIGATIDPGSGIFHWTPTPAQSPSVNLTTLRATDDGIPPLSGERTFTIFVLAPPRVLLNRLPNGAVSLDFPTVGGKTYRVEYKEDLSDSIWTALGNDTVAIFSSITLTDQIGPNSQRFYRILLVE